MIVSDTLTFEFLKIENCKCCFKETFLGYVTLWGISFGAKFED